MLRISTSKKGHLPKIQRLLRGRIFAGGPNSSLPALNKRIGRNVSKDLYPTLPPPKQSSPSCEPITLQLLGTTVSLHLYRKKMYSLFHAVSQDDFKSSLKISNVEAYILSRFINSKQIRSLIRQELRTTY